MPVLFPKEIVENSTQSHFVEHFTKSRIIYTVVIASVILVFVFLPYIKIDISTQSKGIIRSETENIIIQVPITGKIKSVSIYENKQIFQGDTLLVIDTDQIDFQISSYKEKISKNVDLMSDLNKLIERNYKSIKTDVYLSEMNEYRSVIDESKTQLSLLEEEYLISKELYEENITPKLEYLRIKNKFDATQKGHKNIEEKYINKWQAEKKKLEDENLDLQTLYNKLLEEKEFYFIKAPIAGTISDFKGLKKESIVTLGQQIAIISPEINLLAECYISPSKIGFIKVDQKVDFQVDAFNYNQWGLVHGIVKEIFSDVSVINDVPVFRVRCSINESFLELKSGYKGYLKKGMTLNGHFYLNRRSLWDLLYDKIDDWINPKNNQS